MSPIIHFASIVGALSLPLLSVQAGDTSQADPDACTLALEAPSQALVSLPFRTVDGRIYLDAMVNGTGPYVFALDTGASGMGRADASLVEALALPADGQDETSDGVSSATVDRVRVNSLTLGGLERRDVSVIARDYRSWLSPEAAFSGILGRAFFADGLLTIDFVAKRIAFYRSRELLPAQKGALTYERAFRIPVQLGGKEVIANVDTGANVTLVLPGPIASELQLTHTEPGGEGSLTNSSITTTKARFAGPLALGDTRLDDVPVKIARDYPEVLIGAHALQGSVLLIDQRHRTLAVCPSRAR